MNKIDSLYFPYVSAILKNHILLDFSQKMLTSSMSSMYQSDLTVYCDEENYFPLVILVGGVQGSGKSSFIDFCREHMSGVREESTIDCCKDIVRNMVNLEPAKYCRLLEHVQNKDEKYRTLLNHLKSLWCEVDDGPNSIMCGLVDSIVDKSTCPIIFINVREPEQIDHLKHRIEDECGVSVLTLAVLRNDPNDSMNDADKHTLEYNYDIWIKNSMTLVELNFAAMQLCLAIDHSNSVVRNLYNDLLGNCVDT